MTTSRRFGRALGAVAASVLALGAATRAADAQEPAARTRLEPRAFDIPAQPLSGALRDYARQAEVALAAPPALVEGKRSSAVRGDFAPEEALKRLLQGTGLQATRTAGGGLTLTATPSRTQRTAAPAEDTSSDGVSEIVVEGRRTLNADVRRSEDDAQPYVVFGRDDLERSDATNLNDFLTDRLPMNTSTASPLQNATGFGGNTSRVQLRSFGSSQTLILVDGRRLGGFSINNSSSQGDINAIPLSMIERVEILPSTASGIYGGGATGGVINIITRKDYDGGEIGVSYSDTSRLDMPGATIDASKGWSLFGGATRITLAGNYAKTEALLREDRDFTRRSRQLQLQNAPNELFGGGVVPYGYTGNIVSQNGANLVLKSGGALNSPFTNIPVGYAGVSVDGGAALLANAGRFNLDLPNDQMGQKLALLPETELGGFTTSLRQSAGSHIDLFGDLSWSFNQSISTGATASQTLALAANNPSNPFTTAINVTVPTPGVTADLTFRVETWRGGGGAIVRLPANWSLSGEYYRQVTTTEYSQTSPLFGDPDGTGPGVGLAAAYANGTINPIRDVNAFPINYTPYLLPSPNQTLDPLDNTLDLATVRLAGPVFELPAGKVVLNTALEWRQESIDQGFSRSLSTNNVSSASFFAAAEREVLSSYAELKVPLVGGDFTLPLVRELELQLAARNESFDSRTFSPSTATLTGGAALPALTPVEREQSETSYTFAGRWKPVDDLTFRASYATGFVPPGVSSIVIRRTGPAATVITEDPRRGGTSYAATILSYFGGGPDLRPEQSESMAFGFVFEPSFLEGLRFSADYSRIKKTDELTTPTIPLLLQLEASNPDRVVRGPLTPADQALGYTAGPVTELYFTSFNVAESEIESWDFQVDYDWSSATLGSFRFYAVATYIEQLERRTNPIVAPIDYVGYALNFNGALPWRANGGVYWTKGAYGVEWNSQFYDGYYVYGPGSTQAVIDQNVRRQGRVKYESQTYHDLTFTARLGEVAKVLGDTDFRFTISNVFDTSPPIVASPFFAPTGYSEFGDPRLRRFTMTVRKRF